MNDPFSYSKENIDAILKELGKEFRKLNITICEARKLLDKLYGIQYCISTEEGLSVIDGKPRKKGVSWR